MRLLQAAPCAHASFVACHRTIKARTVQNQTSDDPAAISWAMDLGRTAAASTRSDTTGTAVLVSPRAANATGITFNVEGSGSCAMTNGSCAEPVVLEAGRSVTCAFTWWAWLVG